MTQKIEYLCQITKAQLSLEAKDSYRPCEANNIIRRSLQFLNKTSGMWRSSPKDLTPRRETGQSAPPFYGIFHQFLKCLAGNTFVEELQA